MGLFSVEQNSGQKHLDKRSTLLLSIKSILSLYHETWTKRSYTVLHTAKNQTTRSASSFIRRMRYHWKAFCPSFVTIELRMLMDKRNVLLLLRCYCHEFCPTENGPWDANVKLILLPPDSFTPCVVLLQCPATKVRAWRTTRRLVWTSLRPALKPQCVSVILEQFNNKVQWNSWRWRDARVKLMLLLTDSFIPFVVTLQSPAHKVRAWRTTRRLVWTSLRPALKPLRVSVILEQFNNKVQWNS